ncbi:hypothetical protein RB201_18560 [Streptomyces sp. S1A(2023)]
MAYAPDGRTLASGGHDGTVRLWDTAARPGAVGPAGGLGKPLGKPLRLRTGPVGAVAFAPSHGDLLAATGKGGGVQLWDVHDRERPRPVGRPLVSHDGENVVSVTFAPDGRTLAHRRRRRDRTAVGPERPGPAHAARRTRQGRRVRGRQRPRCRVRPGRGRPGHGGLRRFRTDVDVRPGGRDRAAR